VPYFSSLRTSALSAFIRFTYEFNAEFAEVRRERREQFKLGTTDYTVPYKTVCVICG